MANQWDYIDAGFKVFGLLGDADHDGSELPPEQKYKKPRASNWQHTPDWSDDQLELMESMGHFETGYGVLVSGYLVIDIDPRNGGFESYKAMSHDYEADSGFVVRTGGGGLHIYFKAPEGVSLVAKLNNYPGIDFKSSGYVVGSGSLHASGSMYEAKKGSPDKVGTAPQKLIDLLKRPDTYRAAVSGSFMDVTVEDVKMMLSFVSADCDYDTWIKCGMAINQTLNGEGFDVWNDWSKNGSKYPGISQLERHWHSFGKSTNPVTLGTLKHFAEDGGYVEPVTFTPDYSAFDDSENALDTANIDLKRPPGFVGQLTQWINSQCLYPRESMAVAAALSAVGCIAGLRNTDDKDGFSTNLFSFCVASSSTGKEAVQQAFAECLRAAGVSGAVHGAIKSEQEIIRNLVRHQAAYYAIDELGLVLRKIKSATARGGAAYLEGVIGLVMSAYSKANGFMLVSGDVKDDLRKELQSELAATMKAIDEGRDKGGKMLRRADQIKHALDNIDSGLERPFLSIIGWTTPVTFNDLVDFEQATNGFISRALIFEDPDSNPKRKEGFKKQPMPIGIAATLANLYCPGTTEKPERVEFYGDKKMIGSTDDALTALDDVYHAFWKMAEDARGTTGLEAIPRRGYELASKISLILAIPEGVRTAEHVRWAFALAKADIERKMKLAFSNMAQKDDPGNSIAAKIQNLISVDHAETMGVLVNRCRPHKREQVEQILSAMVQAGAVEEIITTNSTNGKEVKKYKLTAH
jgi:hypothetical protein